MTATRRLLESVADIALTVGTEGFWDVLYSGCAHDSREAVSRIISWAEEFETHRTTTAAGDERYFGTDYMTAIEQYTHQELDRLDNRP